MTNTTNNLGPCAGNVSSGNTLPATARRRPASVDKASETAKDRLGGGKPASSSVVTVDRGKIASAELGKPAIVLRKKKQGTKEDSNKKQFTNEKKPFTNENNKRKADTSSTEQLEQGHVELNEEKSNETLPVEASKLKEGARLAEVGPTVTTNAPPNKRRCTGNGKESGELRKGAQEQRTPAAQDTVPQGGDGVPSATNADTGEVIGQERGREELLRLAVAREQRHPNRQNRAEQTLHAAQNTTPKAQTATPVAAPPKKKQCTRTDGNSTAHSVPKQAPPTNGELGRMVQEAQKRRMMAAQNTIPQGRNGVPLARNANTVAAGTPRAEELRRKDPGLKEIAGQAIFPDGEIHAHTTILVTFVLPNKSTLQAYFLVPGISELGVPPHQPGEPYPPVKLDGPQWLEAHVTFPNGAHNDWSHLAVTAKGVGILSAYLRDPSAPAPESFGVKAGHVLQTVGQAGMNTSVAPGAPTIARVVMGLGGALVNTVGGALSGDQALPPPKQYPMQIKLKVPPTWAGRGLTLAETPEQPPSLLSSLIMHPPV